MSALLDSAEVLRFRSAAARFRRAALKVPVDLVELAASMALLYSAACALPDIEPETEEVAEAPRSEYQLDAELRADYWVQFDPWLDEPGDAVFASLADDIVDILRELDAGELLAEQGNADDAVWTWRFSFWTHWGRHVTSSLYAIYVRLALH